MFGHDQIVGRVIRRASGRLLVVQAAGNNDGNACQYAFGYTFGSATKENDGVLVVGGTDRFGKRYPGFGRSNYDPCVEVWAPGHE